MIKVLFVCLGNICRSPLAEAIFDHQIKEQGLENSFSSDSCGTGGYHIGADPDHRSQLVAKQHGVSMKHAARKFQKSDYEAFDYIIPMDQQNYEDIVSATGHAHDGLMLMRKFDPDAENSEDVPDPYFGGQDGFEEVYQMLDRSNVSFISFLRKQHKC
ncbi:MAG: low molecular weight protein-tyrosine-phosphatase [Cyclobacteriaceae bacterium]